MDCLDEEWARISAVPGPGPGMGSEDGAPRLERAS